MVGSESIAELASEGTHAPATFTTIDLEVPPGRLSWEGVQPL